jgi:hypothetical protein
MIRRGTIDSSQRWYGDSDGRARVRRSGTVKSILGRGEHWWDWIRGVYASDVCQFRGIWEL